MGRQKGSQDSCSLGSKGVSRELRTRLALTTILSIAPFIGYGRNAYAACVGSPAPSFICSGDATVNNVTQTVTYDNADVSTAPGFAVFTNADALRITGEGHIQFTDVNTSSLQGKNDGLEIISTGDFAPNAEPAITRAATPLSRTIGKRAAS